MKQTDILNDENLLCYLNLEDFNVNVYLLYQGSSKLKYYFFLRDKLIFEGDDYRPGLMYDIDSLDSMIGLLGFLTLKKSDTDEEYFKDYTKEQFSWSESMDNEDLRCYVSDYEAMDNEYYEESLNFFEKAFTIV